MNISAIIPAYNSAEFIEEAIRSIFNQSRPVDEVIVVDDGSSDDTAHIVESMRYEKIIVLRQENQGPSAARNLGIERASGDWIAFLDADDQWTPNKIQEQLAILEQHPELNLIASDMAEIDGDGRTITTSVLEKHHLLERFQQLDGKSLPNALAVLMSKNFIPTGTVLVKRHTLLEAGLFNRDIRYGEDLELWAKIASRQPITCLPKVHMLRRQHGGNATENNLPMLVDLIAVTRSIRESCAATLKRQHLDADRLVADALWNLGYWHFSQEDFTKAGNTFTESLREKVTKRSLIYRLACALPTNLTQSLRRYKQKITS